MNRKTFNQYVAEGDFRNLFVSEMGWNNPTGATALPEYNIDEQTVNITQIADRNGFQILHCVVEHIPTSSFCRKLDTRLRRNANDYILIFSTPAEMHHLWVVPVKKVEKRDLVMVDYDSVERAEFLFQKMEGLSFGLDERTTISDVIARRLGGLLLCERFLNNAVSLFVTLGLFGTFLGLSLSVASLTELISYSNTSEWLSVLDSVGGGLMSALSGMGVAFYTSLAGAAASILLTVLRTVLSPQAQRERLETRLELWLDTEIAPGLYTEAATDDASLVKRMIAAMQTTAEGVNSALKSAAESYINAMQAASNAMTATANANREVMTRFDGAIGKFNDGVHDFSEVDYNLRGSVERMDLAVRDLSAALREVKTRMEGERK